MAHSSIFYDVLLLLGLSVVAVWLARRIHLPPILAYLLVGVAAGEYGLGLAPSASELHLLAEVGVVFLLFSIGLEFSLTQFLAMRGTLLGLGGLQVVLSGALLGLVAHALGMQWSIAWVIGGTLALSSTAIAIKQLTEQLELHSRHGHLAVAILLFQDLAVVPLLVVIPILGSGGDEALAWTLTVALFKGLLAMTLLLVIGRKLLRPVFHLVAAQGSIELFTLTALFVALSAAAVTHAMGLSLALGAFLAGMVLSETEFRHQVESEIRPFKDVLLGIFFIYVGLHLDVPALWHDPWPTLVLLVALVLGKGALILALVRLYRHNTGVALRTALVLAQGGEFGFAALTLALNHGILSESMAQPVLAAIVLSMFLAPILIRHNGRLAKRFCGARYLQLREDEAEAIREEAARMEGHVVLCGFGRIGQHLSRFLTEEGFRYVAMDLDPALVREAWDAGEPVFYGDCTHQEVLLAAGLERASVLVVTADAPLAAERVIRLARRVRPDLPVLVRTRDDAHLDRLEAAGATEVVPETLEASMMMADHVLKRLGVPEDEILRLIQKARTDHYALLRGRFHGTEPESVQDRDAYHLHTVRLHKGAWAIGRPIRELGLDRCGVRVAALRRGSVRGDWPAEDLVLAEGDAVVLMGEPGALRRAEARLLVGNPESKKRA
jgi:CPA2 family monovalent cation:H+ antiporter-2